MPAGTEGRGDDLADEGNRHGMRTALRLTEHQQPVEELEPLALEHAEVHQAVILYPSPAACLSVGLNHRGHRHQDSDPAREPSMSPDRYGITTRRARPCRAGSSGSGSG